ncbi:MAG: DsrE family protein [Acidiferrobacterales bacterium]
MKKFLLFAFSALLFVSVDSFAAKANMPGVPAIPLKPGLSFNGFFKEHQPVKILFVVGQPGPQLKESLINGALVIKYLKAHNYKYKIHYVLYSRAVAVADEFNQRYSAWAPLLRTLHDNGVTFTVCHNAMVLFHVKSADVYPFMKVIPAGILSVAEYETRGYSPIFNPNTETQ